MRKSQVDTSNDRSIRELALRPLVRHPLSLQADEQRTLEEMDLAKQRLPPEGPFLALKAFIDSLLQTYNGHSSYISLDGWVDGVGPACYECGERYSDDDLIWAWDIEGSPCENCRSYCERCEQYVVYRHYDSGLGSL